MILHICLCLGSEQIKYKFTADLTIKKRPAITDMIGIGVPSARAMQYQKLSQYFKKVHQISISESLRQVIYDELDELEKLYENEQRGVDGQK